MNKDRGRFSASAQRRSNRAAPVRAALLLSPFLAWATACAQDAGGVVAQSSAGDTAAGRVPATTFVESLISSRPMQHQWSWLTPSVGSGTNVKEPHFVGLSSASESSTLSSKLAQQEDRWLLAGMLRLVLSAASARNAAAAARPQSGSRVTQASAVRASADTPAATAAGLIDASALSSQITARSAIGLGGLAGSGQVHATLLDPACGPMRMDAAVVQVPHGVEASEASVFRLLNLGTASSPQTVAVERRLSALGMGAMHVSSGNTDRAAYSASALLDVPLPSAFGFSRGRYVSLEFGHGRSAQTRLSFASGKQGTGSSSTLAIARSHPLGDLTRVSAGLSTTMENNQVTGAIGEGLFDTSGQHVRSAGVQVGMTTQLWRLQLKSWAERVSTQAVQLNGAIDSLSAQTAMAAGIAARLNNLALAGDALALGFTLPARTVSGYASMVSAGQDEDGNPVTYLERVSLRPTGMERVVSLTYSRALTQAAKIQAGVLVRVEPDHIADAKPETAVGVKLMFRLN